MLDQMLLWFVELWPEFNFDLIDPVLSITPYMHWAGQFVDLPFVADVLGWMITIEIAIDVTMLIATVWEKVPGN